MAWLLHPSRNRARVPLRDLRSYRVSTRKCRPTKGWWLDRARRIVPQIALGQSFCPKGTFSSSYQLRRSSRAVRVREELISAHLWLHFSWTTKLRADQKLDGGFLPGRPLRPSRREARKGVRADAPFAAADDSSVVFRFYQLPGESTSPVVRSRTKNRTGGRSRLRFPPRLFQLATAVTATPKCNNDPPGNGCS